MKDEGAKLAEDLSAKMAGVRISGAAEKHARGWCSMQRDNAGQWRRVVFTDGGVLVERGKWAKTRQEARTNEEDDTQ